MADPTPVDEEKKVNRASVGFPYRIQLINSIILPVVSAVLAAGVVVFFARSEAVSVLTERMYRVEDDIKELESQQVDGSLLQSSFNGFQNDISELKGTKADAQLLQNLVNRFDSDLETLNLRVNASCQSIAKLEAITETYASLREECTNLRERVATIEARLKTANSP